MAKKVEIYTTSSCPFCHAAKNFLKSKKVEFQEIDVTSDSQAREKLTQMAGGRETVPQIFAEGKLIGGYEDLVKFYQAGKTL